jgi:hypothetical protein
MLNNALLIPILAYAITILQCFSLHADPTMARAALDFDQSTIKAEACLVDTSSNTIIGNPLLTKIVWVNLIEDIANHHGAISDTMERKLTELFADLRSEAQAAGAAAGCPEVQFSGYAAPIIGKASNGQAILQKLDRELGIYLFVLEPADEEWRDFMDAKALFPQVPEDCLLSWSSGPGSFQITAQGENRPLIYQAPAGYGTLQVILSKEIRKKRVLQPQETGNPISLKEVALLTEKLKTQLPPIPNWLAEKSGWQDSFFATFNHESIFALVAKDVATCKGPYGDALITLSELQEFTRNFAGKEDADFKALGIDPETYPRVLYLSILMDYLGISSLHYKSSFGHTTGMLITPKLWEQE